MTSLLSANGPSRTRRSPSRVRIRLASVTGCSGAPPLSVPSLSRPIAYSPTRSTASLRCSSVATRSGSSNKTSMNSIDQPSSRPVPLPPIRHRQRPQFDIGFRPMTSCVRYCLHSQECVMPAETSGARMDEAMRALADPTRREILRLVHEDELAAGEIARHFPAMSRPAVSQHLRVLAGAGLVTVRPLGNLRLYRCRPEGLSDVSAFVQEMWSDRLEALKAAAEREEWPARERARRRMARETPS